MNKTTEALKLAEEAAEFARNICLGMNWGTGLPDEALAAIREALAEQDKQEPVACVPTLTSKELSALQRFLETSLDNEGYDVPKQMMKRLAEIGVVTHTSRGIYFITEFGNAVLNGITVNPVKQEPVAWHDKIKGMEVSVDVSTGEDDAHHRVFGRVDSVMLESCGAQEDIILVIEESRNYAAPVSAEAIRAEALEEAAKMCFSHGVKHESGTAFGLTAAIRGLK